MGVEPICTTLQFAPATYYAASDRSIIVRIHNEIGKVPPAEFDKGS
jgi:hypothetical protein